MREEPTRSELVTAVEVPAVTENIPSLLVSSSNTLPDGSDAVETNTVAVDEVECTILLLFIVLGGFGCRSGRSHIGYQGGFHTIYGLPIHGLLAISPEYRNHDRLDSKRGAVRQPIDAPCFLGLKHFNFGCVLRRTVQPIIHCCLQRYFNTCRVLRRPSALAAYLRPLCCGSVNAGILARFAQVIRRLISKYLNPAAGHSLLRSRTNGESLDLGIEVNRALRMTMSIELPTEHMHEPAISCDTALSCLVRLGVCRGDDPEIEAFRRSAVLDGNTLPASRLVELVGKFGVQAECTTLDWNGLTKNELSYPILVFLKNANAVVVTGTDGAAAEAVSVWDPLHSDGEALSVPHEDFERAWSGDALVIARQPSTGAEASPDPAGEQNVEIIEPPADQSRKRAPIAEAQLVPGSVPVARPAKSGRLAAIGLSVAAGIGIPLLLNSCCRG